MSRAHPRFTRNNPPLPPLATLAYRAQIIYLMDNQICLSGFDIIMSSNAQGPLSEANLATSVESNSQTVLRAILASDCFITAYKVTCLTQPTRMPYVLATAGGGVAGTVTGAHLPTEMAMLVKKLTNIKGQHGRGRMYFPGVPVSFLTPTADANRLNNTGGTALQAVVTNLVTASFTDGGNTGVIGLTTTPPSGQPTQKGSILSFLQEEALLGVIRRRRIGRGK